MDPSKSAPSSSTPEGMVPIAQLEQLFRIFQPNFNISQALAAIAPPPPAETTPAQTPAIPPKSEAAPASVPTTEPLEEVNPEMSGGGVEAEGERVDEDEGAGVAPEMVEEDLALTDAEGVERVMSRMASEDVEKSADKERVEEVMAEIEAEMREGRAPTVEGLERVETGGGRIETGEKEGEVIFDVSDSEEEEVQHTGETGAQIWSASRLRWKFLLEESDDEVQQQRVAEEPQTGGASRQKRKILAEELEEEEDGEEEVLRSQPEAQKPVEQVAQPAPAVELERKRKGKQPELPLRKSSGYPPPR